MGPGRAVTLIIPPSPFLLDERVFVSLGVLRVAASLESCGVHVSVLDLSGVGNYLDAVRAHLLQRRDDWVGLTATTPQLPNVMNILRCIRETCPQQRIVLGGPHVTLAYSARKLELQRGQAGTTRAGKAVALLESSFDVLVSGDGELAVLAVFDPDCPKVVDGDDHRGPYFLSDGQYERLPQPARHLVDMTSYRYAIDGFPATSLIAQLGCPFYCGFCGGRNARSLRLVRKRSAESIVSEIEGLYRTYGYTGFMFYDDELNVNKNVVELMRQIARLQERLGVEFRLRGFIKAELFDEEQAEAMWHAGFRWLLCGFEGANARILENIEKRATLEDNTRVIEISRKFGLKVKALMSIGHPGESMHTIEDVRRWLIQMQVDDFDCTVITTYPGTPYYDLAQPHPDKPGIWTYTHPRTGDRLHAYELDYAVTADYYKGDPEGGYRAYVFTDHLEAEEIVVARNDLERAVRSALGIPYNTSRAALRYEHSMGQGLPPHLLRQSARLAVSSGSRS